MSDFDERMASAKAVERELYGAEKPPVDSMEAAYRMTENYYFDLQNRRKAEEDRKASGLEENTQTCLPADREVGTDPEPEQIARDINVITAEIQFYKKQAGRSFLEIGRRLNEAKAQLSHGEWLPWLEKQVDISERSAQRFMQLASEYGKSAKMADLGASKALQLLALNPVDRDQFLAEKHELDGQEKTVAEMSSRELEKALRERDEALAAKKAAEEKAGAAEERSAKMKTKLDTALAAANDLESQRAAAEARSKELSDKLKAERDKVKEAKATAERARQELEELKKKPIDVAVQQPSEETLEKLKEDAEAAAEEKVKAAETALAEAETRADAAEQEAAKARKQLELADKATTAFQFFFEEWQHKYNAMLGALMQVGDTEKRDKLKAAIRAAVQKMGEQV